jgi:hypothetical protein
MLSGSLIGGESSSQPNSASADFDRRSPLSFFLPSNIKQTRCDHENLEESGQVWFGGKQIGVLYILYSYFSHSISSQSIITSFISSSSSISLRVVSWSPGLLDKGSTKPSKVQQ